MSDLIEREASVETVPAAESAPAGVETATEETKDEALASTENEAADDASEEGEEPENEEGGEDGQDDQPKRKRSRAERERRRHDRLVRQNAALQERIRLYETERGQGSERREAPAAQEDPRPKQTDFEDPFEYGAALSAWSVRQENRKFQDGLREDSRRSEAETGARAVLSKFEQRAAEFAKTVTDFHEVMNDDFEVRPSSEVAALVVRHENGPALAYHLARNPELVEDLNELSALDAAMKLGSIANRLTVPKPRTVTKASTPIQPLKGSSAVNKDPKDMSVDEYAKWRASGGGGS